MSNKKSEAEKYDNAFKFLLKEPINTKNSLQKYLLHKKHVSLDTDALSENYKKVEEALQKSSPKIHSQTTSKLNPETRKLNFDKAVINYTTNEKCSSASQFRKITPLLEVTKNSASETYTSGQTLKKNVDMKRPRNMIENDFRTAKEEEEEINHIQKRRSSNEIETEKDIADYDFKTARQELKVQTIKRHGNSSSIQAQKKGGVVRKGAQGKFVSPVLSNDDIENSSAGSNECPLSAQEVDERLKNIEPKMIELIRSEIMDNGPTINWDDIAGLEFAKTSIQEAVVWPMLRPDIFTGLRRPPKAILLFGPPGTGKTLIGKCVASQSKSTFFSISASSLTSKWIGDGEKMVRALFSVARCHQPAVIFIDEIDSLLSQRSDSEHESSRRIKTEFLVQLDGATTDSEERILVIGATNRPQELDEAARRRFVKRLYIPLPELEARRQLVRQLVKDEKHLLSDEEITRIAELTDGYSGADLKNLCCDAALGPIRSLDFRLIETISAADVRPICMDDFHSAFQRVKSSVAEKDLEQLITWNNTYGSHNSF